MGFDPSGGRRSRKVQRNRRPILPMLVTAVLTGLALAALLVYQEGRMDAGLQDDAEAVAPTGHAAADQPAALSRGG